MTNISKEAVDRMERALEDQCNVDALEMLRALSARVEELRVQVELLEISLDERVSEWVAEKREKAAKRNGRLQGLNEAKAKVEELWACRTCREVADAIEALKGETTND